MESKFVKTAHAESRIAPPGAGTAEFGVYLRLAEDAKRFSGTVLIAKQEAVLYQGAFGLANADWRVGNTFDTRFRLGSLTKPFTATAVLKLASQGRLEIEAPICSYLKTCPAAWEAVTVHHLLNHTSGIPDYLRLPRFWSAAPHTHERMVATFSVEPLQFVPGEEFRYSNSGYFLLGLILEAVAGVPYDQVVNKLILEPLGMESTGYEHSETPIPRRASGYRIGEHGELLNARYVDMDQPFSDGGLYSTSGDLLRFARSFETSRLLSAADRQTMQARGKGNYGYGWWVAGAGSESDPLEISHGGNINGFSAWLSRYPGEQITVIMLSNLEETDGRHITRDLYSILKSSSGKE